MKGIMYGAVIVGLIVAGAVVYFLGFSNNKSIESSNVKSGIEVSSNKADAIGDNKKSPEKIEAVSGVAKVVTKTESKKSNTPKMVNIAGLKKGGIADALLTKDALMGVILELSLAGCDEYDSHEAYMLKNPVMTSEKEGSWQERWVASGCGNKYQVDFNFHEIIGQGTDWTVLK